MLSRKCTRTRSDHILESILPWPKLFKCWGDRTIFSMKWQNSCWKWDLLLRGFTACPRKGQDSSSPHTKERLLIGGCCQQKRCATKWGSTKGETNEDNLCSVVVNFVSTVEFRKSTTRKDTITSPETGATRRVARSRIGTSRYHLTET